MIYFLTLRYYALVEVLNIPKKKNTVHLYYWYRRRASYDFNYIIILHYIFSSGNYWIHGFSSLFILYLK